MAPKDASKHAYISIRYAPNNNRILRFLLGGSKTTYIICLIKFYESWEDQRSNTMSHKVDDCQSSTLPLTQSNLLRQHTVSEMFSDSTQCVRYSQTAHSA